MYFWVERNMQVPNSNAGISKIFNPPFTFASFTLMINKTSQTMQRKERNEEKIWVDFLA